MLNVKILGVGCPHCKRLEAETRAALDAEGIAYEMKIIHGADIVSYGVMSIPALVINERVVSCGRIPPCVRIKEWAKEGANTAD
ncbi:MAG: thioredoxin family protein [Anaerolineae bacterium]|nr:thioredoxin family protein [Anaerolineae bacterium]